MKSLKITKTLKKQKKKKITTTNTGSVDHKNKPTNINKLLSNVET